MTTTAQLTKVLQGEGLPPEALLGYAVISSIPDAPVKHGLLESAWKGAGLSEDLIPSKRGALGVFRAACRSVETRRHNGGDIEQRTEVKVDEVVRRNNHAVYQVTRLVRDSENELIDHPKAMRVTWAPKGINVEPLEQDHYDALRPLEGKIREHYQANLDTVTGAQVRGMVGATLSATRAIALRSGGGVLFVPMSDTAADRLGSLREVFAAIGIERANFITLPMVNSEYERQVLEHHYTVSAIEGIDLMLREVSKHSKSDHAVRIDTTERLARQRGEIARAHSTYRNLLKSELAAVSDKLDLLDEGLDYLATKEVNT